MARRWKNNPRPTGLAAVCAPPQGSTLRDGDEDLANTGCLYGSWNEKKGWWYWSCPSNKSLGIEHRNTCHQPVPTQKEARAQAKAYIDSCFKQLINNKEGL